MKFIRTSRFTKDLKRVRATLAEADEIEREIANNPEVGDVIVGLRGVRKMRFRLGNRGKSGGGRAIYFLMLADDLAVLLTAYTKNEQSDLTPAQKKAILKALEGFEND